MSWFVWVIAASINILAKSLQSIFGLSMYNVIATSMMQTDPGFGMGHFSDVIGTGRIINVLNPFATAFGALAATFFLVSIYLYTMAISGAANSAIQRERLKRGAVSLVLTVVLIFGGQPFAVLVTQFFYHLSLYFLHLGGADQPLKLNNVSGNDALLAACVNLLQVVLAFIVWIIYQFRALFLDVWIVFFPLAMAFFANEKTKGITKMWWTEWIYQMSIPFGQAVVFGIAYAIGTPGKPGQLTIAEIFSAIAGTVGLLGSAVYMRKLIDMVAQGFGAQSLGHSAGEHVGHGIAVGLGAGAADKLGGMAVKGSSKIAGATLGKGAKALDKAAFGGLAKKALNKFPETHASAIQNGASIDDMMMHHQMAAMGGDALHGAQSVGAEHASNGGVLGGKRGGGSDGTFKAARTVLHSNTAGEIGNAISGVKQGFRNSNAAVALGAGLKGFRNNGGVSGLAGGAVAKGAQKMGGAPANVANRYLANQATKRASLQNTRDHLGNVMALNRSAQRMPGLNSAWDAQNNEFTDTPAQARYNQAEADFRQSLPETEADHIINQSEAAWKQGKNLNNLKQLSPHQLQKYSLARSAYGPKKLDDEAMDWVKSGQLRSHPVDNHHKNLQHQSSTIMNDARIAMMRMKMSLPNTSGDNK